MPSAHVTCPLTAATLAGPPSDRPSPSKNFGERARRLINERGAAAASTDNKCMVVSENRPAEAEPPPQPSTFLDAAFYLKLQATLEVFFWEWGVFIQQFQFNDLDNRMSKLEKGQNVNNSAEETAVDLDGEMSVDAKLIINFITQQVSAGMDKKTK